MYYLTPDQRRLFQVLGWADWMQVFVTLGLTKISICLFLLRIVESRVIVRGMYALIGFTALFSSVCFFIFVGVCRPLRAYWDVDVEGHCLSKRQVEATVIAQGGESSFPLSSYNSKLKITVSSSLNHHRSHLRRPPIHLPSKPASQPPHQIRTLHPNGSGRNVRHPLPQPPSHHF